MKVPIDSMLVYLDTSIFAGDVLRNDAEDKQCATLMRKIVKNEFRTYTFITSIFTLIELAELIARKKTKNRAKAILFDIMNNPDLPVYLVNPEPIHRRWGKREYFDIDLLIAHFVNTALDHRIPGFDTIHAHTIINIGESVIAVSKDAHFGRFKGLKNVVDVVRASAFLQKYK